ncbi:MAG TPA: protease inhibitor I42 family protein [Candidatus Limnocylindrales bacterium]|nr:protease inhibitor I42 family protein [Candidatus Limnocylindrales bacterium]
MPDVTLTASDTGKTIAVNRNDIVTLQLGESASTGYLWTITAPDGVTVLHEEHVQPPDAMIGGGGTKYFRLLVSRAGTFVVRASLARPWQGAGPPTEQLVFVLAAEP